ncbi:MAG: hypothetical protein ACYSW4_05395 [Planctomycetota bacterium]|jgi:hypothetical protein
MIRLFEIAVFSFLLCCLTGCNGPEESEPIWEKVKIGDLAASDSGKQPGGQALKTINFNVFIFEMPAEKVSTLDDIRQMLYMEPLRFKDYDAFAANLFSAGLGQGPMWNEIRALLDGGGGRKVRTVSLLLPDGQANDVAVARIPRGRTVFYFSGGGSMDGETIGPGRFALRIKAEKIPGLRGVCSVKVQPVFTVPTISPVPHLAARAKSDEFVFGSAGFGLKMSAGDFFFLGPQKYIKNRMTLGSYFFSRPAPSPGVRILLVPPSSDTQKRELYFGPVVRTYLVVCTGIKD